MTPRRRADRFRVAWHARDDRCARDVMTIELSDPPIGELVGAARRLPRERLQRGIASQRGEERRREEMTVRVVDDHSQ